MFRLAAFLGAVALTSPAVAEDSVVLGHGISNAFLSRQACPQPTDTKFAAICMDANYVWVLDAVHTVAGPSVSGRVRAIASQHVDATDQFVKSVEIFVLRPIDDSALQKSSGATYYLVSLSARDVNGKYCLSVAPKDEGLKLDASEISVDPASGYFCFQATAVRLTIVGGGRESR
jgi:hypothetical protein